MLPGETPKALRDLSRRRSSGHPNDSRRLEIPKGIESRRGYLMEFGIDAHADRRQAALAALMWRLASRDLSSTIAIEVRSAVLWPSNAARVDMGAASRDKVCRALSAWRDGLPLRVRLTVVARRREVLPQFDTVEGPTDRSVFMYQHIMPIPCKPGL